MSDMHSVVEEHIHTIMKGKNLPFKDAAKQASLLFEQLGSKFDVAKVIAEVTVAHKQKSVNVMKLHEVSVSTKKDSQAQAWYTPQQVPDDGVWAGLKRRMNNAGLKNAVRSIDDSSDAVISCCAEPLVIDDRRKGLVVGNVQSGKTANYAAVAAKAYDSGYKLVIVLSGVHNNLRRQTQSRLERDLGVSEDLSNWHLLTDTTADFGKADEKNSASIVAHSKRVLAVVKKNKTRLENLLAFLAAMDFSTKKSAPILIIDDESDQATPDASLSEDADPTAISELIRKIWGQVVNGTYIGYTATPFANIFMDPNSSEENLYPEDFIHVMPTSENYFGAERLFGLEAADPELPDADGPDVVREVPDDEKKLLSAKLIPDDDQSQKSVPASLRNAVCWFVAATALRRIRGQETSHSTMLIHTTHMIQPHFTMQKRVVSYLEWLKQEVRERSFDTLEAVYNSEIGRASELLSSGQPQVPWSEVAALIPDVLHNIEVFVDNSQVEQSARLNYDDTEPVTAIVIGGGTLSRGLTLEGLFVSYFTRSSNTYDTLLQMGRWFGYRPGYEDLQRIWVSDQLDEEYRFLAKVERDLRADIGQMILGEKTPAEIGVRVLQHPGRLQITTAGKMKYANAVEVDFEGYRFQTTLFDTEAFLNPEPNVEAVRSLLASISDARPQREDDGASKGSPAVFKGVPFSNLEAFFGSFKAHERFDSLKRDAVEWTKKKLPQMKWNVVVASGSSGSVFDFDFGHVKQVSRSVIRFSGKERDADVNIRALMSGNDSVSDINSTTGFVDDKSKLKAKEVIERRRSKDGAAGSGLLVIYPIDRLSDVAPKDKFGGGSLPTDSRIDGPSEKSTRANPRISMRKALEKKLSSKNVESEKTPLIGIAVITPFDTDNVIENKGTFFAVTPQFTDVEVTDEGAEVDSEPDYDGMTS